MKTKVVVTGIGLVSPLGNSPEELWRRLAAGESAAEPFPFKWSEQLGFAAAGVCRVKNFLPPSRWMTADRQIQFAVAAAKSAVKDAGLADAAQRKNGAVYLSSSKGGIASLEKAHAALLAGGPSAVPDDFLPNFWASTPASAIAQTLGVFGPSLNFVSACASGAHSIMMGSRWVQRNPESWALAGATEASLTPLVLSAFHQMGVLAQTGNGNPGCAAAPFDAHRGGFVVGEGCALLVLESRDRALERGARIYGELAGAAAAGDPSHRILLDKSGESIERVARSALADAAFAAEEVDYVNLHATATVENDRLETRGVKRVWQNGGRLSFSGTKPATGHLLGASGAIEAAITVLALQHQFAPPTLNLRHPDGECDLDYTALAGKRRDIRAAMSLSYGFGGQLASLLFKKAD